MTDPAFQIQNTLFTRRHIRQPAGATILLGTAHNTGPHKPLPRLNRRVVLCGFVKSLQLGPHGIFVVLLSLSSFLVKIPPCTLVVN